MSISLLQVFLAIHKYHISRSLPLTLSVRAFCKLSITNFEIISLWILQTIHYQLWNNLILIPFLDFNQLIKTGYLSTKLNLIHFDETDNYLIEKSNFFYNDQIYGTVNMGTMKQYIDLLSSVNLIMRRERARWVSLVSLDGSNFHKRTRACTRT